METLEQAILDIIQSEYCKKYTGLLKVERLQPNGILVKLGLNTPEKPIQIAAQLEDEQFLKFFRQELRERNLNTVKYFDGVQTIVESPYNCCNEK